MASSSSDDLRIGDRMDVDNGNAGKQPEELFPGCTSVNDFSQRTLRMVLQATKASNELPTGDDYDYYSTYDSVRSVLDIEARRLLTLLQSVMRHHNVKGTISGTTHALELDEQFDVIMDANDQILERVGTQVDEATGVRKNEQKLVVAAVSRPNPAVASWNKKRSGTGSSVPVQLLTAKYIQRPQVSFRDKVDNSNKPFVPCIRHKPHAKRTLQESLQLPEGITLEDTENATFVYPHPYQLELDEWQPISQQLEKVTPQDPQPVDSTVPEFVDTVSDLAELCDLLTKEKEIAVDLEHHSYRTYQGFVCLMQVSTRRKDYLVDTLALRSDMSMLNQVFADPSITKVFHGADSDIEWLQRDFGIYVVNMFDTGQAARVLSSARFSLSHLLQTYCQVEADKQYQLSDWRIRPLHEKMIRYAQEDTHYLLYIYDRMRNELIERGNEQRNLLQSVYQRSKMVCLKVYRKPQLSSDSHLDLYLKSKKVFNCQQLMALREMYGWRDRTAREEDESVQYVLPNHMLLQMAEILPRERQGVLACCNPIPPLVRQCQHELHAIILAARETPLIQTKEKRGVLEPSPLQHPQYHTSITACPHDLSKNSGEHGHLEASSTGSIVVKMGSSLLGSAQGLSLKNRPILSALDPLTNQVRKKMDKVALKVKNSFGNPFACFLPKMEDSQKESIMKPKTEAKVWRLKQHTASVPHKRKSDVDLNTFVPEFAPPIRKKHIQVETPKSTTATMTTAVVSSPAAAASPDTPREVTEEKKKKVKAVEEEALPLSSRQMIKKKKKEKKAMAKKVAAMATEAHTATTFTVPPLFSIPAHGPNKAPSLSASQTLASEEKKKKKKKKKKENLSVSFAAEPELPMEGEEGGEEETKKKRKKKKENLSVSFTAEQELPKEGGEGGEEETKKKRKKKKEKEANLSVSFAAEPELPMVGEEGGEEETKKKKRKKKKGGAAKVEEEVEVTPFDYSSADKSAVTGKVKKTDNVDVYNPHFKRDKKKKKGKKERFGAKQKKSLTFKADSADGKGKK